jgi:formylglycine-generating enzyme
MSIVAKRTESRDPRNSFTAATFRKVLKGFEIGGLPYAELESQLKRLLATGVPPTELREVLRRNELIEPLPEYAYREVAGLLDAAIEQEAALRLDSEDAIDQAEQLDPATLSANLKEARDALESERMRAREAEEALSERIVSEDSVRSRLDMTLRESERYQGELRAARNAVASRDKVTAQMRQTLDQRDAELAAVRREHAELAAALDSRSVAGERLQADLQTLRAQAAAAATELAASRDALEKERRKRQEIERTLSDSGTLSAAARESSASRDKIIAEVRQTLAERDAQLAALQRQHAETLSSHRSRATSGEQLASELQVVRGQAAAGAADLAAARESLASQGNALAELRQTLAERDAQLAALSQRHAKAMGESEARAQEKLQAVQKRVTGANAELDGLRAQVAGLQSKLRDSNALIEKLGASVRSEARRAMQWQAAAQRESKAAQVMPRGEVPPPAEVLPRVEVPPPAHAAQAAASLLPRLRWNVRSTPPAIWIGTAVLLLAAIWFVVHRPTPAPSQPAVAKAAVIQPGTTIRDCPTCPGLTVLPTGRFEQGSAPAENGSTFEKPLHWVMISHPIALSTNAVTVDEFREFVAATGRDMQGCDTYDGEWRHHAENNWENPGFVQTGSHPVTCASWNDAKAYAAWLSAKTGQHYRLPSASEWEYAARAGGAAAQPWSAAASDACANANVADQSAGHRFPGWAVFACNDGYVQTSPVGSFKANAFGLNDMLGNVFQWTDDCWNEDYKGAPIDGTARMDGNCAERELRGGSWFSSPNYVRANYRNHFAVDYRTSTVGIRLARDIAS